MTEEAKLNTEEETIEFEGGAARGPNGISAEDSDVFRDAIFPTDRQSPIRPKSSADSDASSVESMSNRRNNSDEMNLTREQMTTFADVITQSFASAMKAQASTEKASNVPSSFKMPPLGVTGNTLSSGLEVLHAPRSGKAQANAGVTSKHSRGDNDSSRLKRKKIVTVALTDKLACNNVLSIITSDDLGRHDLAVDCSQWQVAIRGFKRVLIENDMMTPFMIPSKFDINDPSVIQGPFTSLLDDFHKIPDELAQLWQQYLCKHAAPVELESDTWAVTIMEKSMTPELKTLVFDDIQDLDSSANGAITMFKLASNHMVMRNQESIDALQDWLRNFDIRKVKGENVSIASTQVKAVIRALDDFGLPTNALRCILDGFAHASSEPFKQLCVTLSTMNRSVLMQNMQTSQTVKQKCFAVLKDLETTYIDLSTGHKWEGVGNTESASAFVAQPLQEVVTTHEQAYAMAARQKIPFEEWVKDKTCHACGKTGHIKPDCPDNKGSGRFNGKGGGGRGRGGGRGEGRGRGGGGREGHRAKSYRDERRFKKAYKLALETMENEEDTSSGDESNASASPRANVAGVVDDEKESIDSLAAHAARMYSSLKD